MAKVAIPVQYKITSDLSASELANDDVVYAKFSLTMGDAPQQYGALDLSLTEGKELADVLARYFEAARKAGSFAEGKAKASSAGTAPDALQVVRRWAISVTPELKDKPGEFAGYRITLNEKDGEITLERPSAKGRLSQDWKDAYAMIHAPKADEGHASEAVLNAVLGVTDESAKDATPEFVAPKPKK